MAKKIDDVQSLVKISVPVMTPAKFAKESGLDERVRNESGDKSGVVDNLIQKGHLPSVKLGKHRLVNVAAYTSECLSTES